MADLKQTLLNKWTLTAAGGAGGYFVGKRYIKQRHGQVYGVLGGAVAGYLVGKLLEPKVGVPEIQAAQATVQQLMQQVAPGTFQGHGGYGDYVDIDEVEDRRPVVPAGASAHAHRAAQVQREAAAAMRQPPREDVANTEDLSEGWNGTGGSLGGGLGAGLSDSDLDDLIAQGKRRGN